MSCKRWTKFRLLSLKKGSFLKHVIKKVFNKFCWTFSATGVNFFLFYFNLFIYFFVTNIKGICTIDICSSILSSHDCFCSFITHYIVNFISQVICYFYQLNILLRSETSFSLTIFWCQSFRSRGIGNFYGNTQNFASLRLINREFIFSYLILKVDVIDEGFQRIYIDKNPKILISTSNGYLKFKF